MADLKKVAEVNGLAIKHSEFYQQCLVFIPKGNGSSEMLRFDTLEEAKDFINQNYQEEGAQEKLNFWWDEKDK